MSVWRQWKEQKVLNEFNGPHGQPDPSGVSTPSLSPRLPMPATPTSGTQPGMSFQSPALDSLFNQFFHALQQQPKRIQREMVERLGEELGVDHFDHYCDED